MASADDMLVLSHPFRLRPDGSVATVLDGTDEAYAESIAILALTRRNERPLVPDFGTTDPTFEPDMDLAELNVGLALYGPPVTVTDVSTTYVDDTTARVVVEFENDDQEDPA